MSDSLRARTVFRAALHGSALQMVAAPQAEQTFTGESLGRAESLLSPANASKQNT